jgi:hypothetical protein
MGLIGHEQFSLTSDHATAMSRPGAMILFMGGGDVKAGKTPLFLICGQNLLENNSMYHLAPCII